MRSGVLLIDACCLINLVASEKLDDILAVADRVCGVADYVLRNEVLSRLVPEPGTGVLVKEALDLSPTVSAGVLKVFDIEGEIEADLAIRHVLDGLDDGEAVTCAIAATRGFAVATDERKAWKAMEGLGVPLASTISLIKDYVEKRGVSQDDLGQLARLIRERGRFLAPKHDPLREWWREALLL